MREFKSLMAMGLAIALAVSCSSTTITGEPAATEAAEEAAVEQAQVEAATTQANPTERRKVQVLDAGAEPRVLLQTAATEGTTVTVTATEESDSTFGTTNERESFVGDYDLDLTTTASAAGFTLTTGRTVRVLDSGGPAPDLDAIVGFRQNYTDDGLAIFVINEQEAAYRRYSGGLLSTPNLLLAAPDEPIGVGATYTIPLDAGSQLLAQVTVLALTDETVEIDLSFERTTDEGAFTMTAVGTYDRSSLLAHDVTTISRMSRTTTVSENGQAVPFSSEQESVRIYREVSS